MKRPELTRRDFTKLSVAAFGGIVSGAIVGCNNASNTSTPPAGGNAAQTEEGTGSSETKPEGGDAGGEKVALNACRGLNACKGLGKGEHECAGQGSCATDKPHGCHGDNTCKNLGGCGSSAGANECAGKGECGVPMKPDSDAWKNARTAFEKRMKEAMKSFGDAPAA